ncbi:ferric reductase like transmembrane component-domain-containing protein [Elsinoe ampelina]|uniref:Ferric reductase like transmembrane component-domain-containing protein n=1 Tax=Elsinoe ampelina TaxID=302913 RepID=A0A6A6GJT8_9PEZI|nr:ferric reductase like transmembrane component-domain-containing protein [Elsinoe ampelina]
MRARRNRNKTTLRDNDIRKTENAPQADRPESKILIIHESSPLLGQQEKRSARRPALVTRVRWSVSSWLMYQPRPIPVVNKTLPANLTSVAISLFILFNAFFFFYNIPFVYWAVYVFADRAGLLFVANLPLLYLFSAKNCPLKSMTGFSYENLNILHRRLGEILCLYALIHATLFLYIWYDELRPIGFTFWQLLSSPIIWLGFSAFACYEILYLTSLASFRAAFYEVFLASHILLQTGGLSFLFFHHDFTRPYVSAALAIFLTDRLLYRLFLTRHTTKADLTILPDNHTLLLSTNFPLPTPRPSLLHHLRRLKPDITPGWSPADHVFISIPSLPLLSAVQSHPFTIASTAPDPTQSHAWLDLIIRARSGFSRTLLDHAKKHHRVDVAIDGPYGSHHALEMARSSSTAVFVAGGSGIAVVLPLAWDLLTSASTSGSTSTSTPGPGPGVVTGEGRRKVVLIWVVHDASHIEWVGQERLRDLRERGCEVVVPEPTSEKGRPDMVRLMAQAVGEARDGVGVMVSGPDGMNREVNNICAAMRGRGVGVRVSVEKFGW